MRFQWLVPALAVIVSACGHVRYSALPSDGVLYGRPLIVWVGEDKFVYIPTPRGEAFGFRPSGSAVRINPGIMYTDGGSIPRFAQSWRGFSSWGYGPAYVVHDWIFYAHQCMNAGKYASSFEPIRQIDFDRSADILGEIIKLLIESGAVRDNPFAADTITGAVDSVFARARWDSAECAQVSPEHIAMVMRAFNMVTPPPSWGLTPDQSRQAVAFLSSTPKTIVSPMRQY